MLTGFTLYIIPSSASDSYQVTTTYRDANANVITKTDGHLKHTLWQQLFLVFAMPFTRDQSDEIFYDLARDSVIEASSKISGGS